MKEYFKRQQCDKCGKEHDSALTECPNCGAPSGRDPLTDPFKNMTPLGYKREILFFAIGLFGIQLIAAIVQIIALTIAKEGYIIAGFTGASLSAAMQEFTNSGLYYTIVEVFAYLTCFLIIIALLDSDFWRLMRRFKDKRVLLGLAIGVGNILFAILYIRLISLGGFGSSNDNQDALNKIIKEAPLLSVIIFGLVGPFCEEVAYRVGLFGFLKRINTWFAYGVSALIFGLIHMQLIGVSSNGIYFNFSVQNLITLPIYLVGGISLSLAYDKFGFGAALLAHMTNNLYNVIATIIANNINA
ncbi:MAG: CPBP family intramembrane metalloprotease [Bacilli bacterium]|nr:CPBP family intramembrane metalloprotease [Bacilli bacterium]